MDEEFLDALEIICEAEELDDREKLLGVRAVLFLNKLFDKIE
jgi:hypothetical protein